MGSSLSVTALTFNLTNDSNETSPESSVELLKGRQMQYQVKKTKSKNKSEEKNTKLEEDEEGFLTLIRYNDDNADGKATALLNWKLLIVEVGVMLHPSSWSSSSLDSPYLLGVLLECWT